MSRGDRPTIAELAKQALSSTMDGYDLLAPKFEHTSFRTPDPIAFVIAERARGVGAALDACCGTGAALYPLRAAATDRVVGIDFSAGMLAVARERLRDAPGTATVELVRGDVLEMPFRNEFDFAVSVGAFGHILPRDEPRFVANIFRALAPGGRFAFATSEVPRWTSPWRWAASSFNAAMHVRNALVKPEFVMFYLTFTWPGVRELLIEGGFRDVTMERGVFPTPYGNVLYVSARK